MMTTTLRLAQAGLGCDWFAHVAVIVDHPPERLAASVVPVTTVGEGRRRHTRDTTTNFDAVSNVSLSTTKACMQVFGFCRYLYDKPLSEVSMTTFLWHTPLRQPLSSCIGAFSSGVDVGCWTSEPMSCTQQPRGNSEEEQAADEDRSVVESVPGDGVRDGQGEENRDGCNPEDGHPTHQETVAAEVEGPWHERLACECYSEEDGQCVGNVEPDGGDRHHCLECHQAAEGLQTV